MTVGIAGRRVFLMVGAAVLAATLANIIYSQANPIHEVEVTVVWGNGAARVKKAEVFAVCSDRELDPRPLSMFRTLFAEPARVSPDGVALTQLEAACSEVAVAATAYNQTVATRARSRTVSVTLGLPQPVLAVGGDQSLGVDGVVTGAASANGLIARRTDTGECQLEAIGTTWLAQTSNRWKQLPAAGPQWTSSVELADETARVWLIDRSADSWLMLDVDPTGCRTPEGVLRVVRLASPIDRSIRIWTGEEREVRDTLMLASNLQLE